MTQVVRPERSARSVARGWILLAVAVVFEVTATLTLNVAVHGNSWLFIVVAVGYVGSFGALALILKTGMPLSVAYGIWAACGVALTALLSTLIFAEPMNLLMVMGLVLIIGGVIAVEMGGEKA